MATNTFSSFIKSFGLLLAISSLLVSTQTTADQVRKTKYATQRELSRNIVKQEAHILRGVNRAIALLTDKEFLRQNPKFKKLPIEKVVAIMLEHDFIKVSGELHKKNSAIRFLARNRGRDFTKDSDGGLKKFAKMDSYNRKEKQFKKMLMIKEGFTKEERRLTAAVEDALDLFDTTISRAEEFGKTPDQMTPASKYIAKDSRHQRSKRLIKDAVPIAKYLENNPKYRHHFTMGLDDYTYSLRRTALVGSTFDIIKDDYRVKAQVAAAIMMGKKNSPHKKTLRSKIKDSSRLKKTPIKNRLYTSVRKAVRVGGAILKKAPAGAGILFTAAQAYASEDIVTEIIEEGLFMSTTEDINMFSKLFAEDVAKGVTKFKTFTLAEQHYFRKRYPIISKKHLSNIPHIKKVTCDPLNHKITVESQHENERDRKINYSLARDNLKLIKVETWPLYQPHDKHPLSIFFSNFLPTSIQYWRDGTYPQTTIKSIDAFKTLKPTPLTHKFSSPWATSLSKKNKKRVHENNDITLQSGKDLISHINSQWLKVISCCSNKNSTCRKYFENIYDGPGFRPVAESKPMVIRGRGSK